jgi:nitroimidazol reductase NimA-like FMN-containing flavoprotein (pyridoxamine 5'-phosphate oxidase superfamily)
MFRTMRRFRQQLTHEECERILAEATSGVLALSGDDGYPYAVPLSHVYQDGKLYFHCAKEGHKLDSIRRNEKVSFCVIAQDEVIPAKRTTAYISVIAFGKAVIVDDELGLRRIAGLIGEKFPPTTRRTAGSRRTR